MNNLFNINIESHEYGFKYGCLASTVNEQLTVESIDYTGGYVDSNYNVVQFESESALTYQNGVYSTIDTFPNFVIKDQQQTKIIDDHLLNIKILFPDFSIETYENSPLYVFKASTYINGCEVILCQRLINRLEALAETGDLKLFNQRYFESITFNILDPMYICFDGDWVYFRENVCKWNDIATINDYNDEGCVLRTQLIPILRNNDGTYSENEKYSGGSNSIFVGMNNNELHTDLSIIEGKLANTIYYNSHYDSLESYIEDTYMKNLNRVENTFTIINDKGDYIDLEDVDPETDPLNPDIFILNLPDGTNWNDYRDGMFATCMTALFDDDNNLILSMFADEFAITPEKFAVLLSGTALTSSQLENENIQELQNMNYDIVNKIENNIVEVVRPDDDSDHIITPIFVRTKDAQNLEIYTKVTENITLRLDAYKSSVKRFVLQIEGVEFNEIARSPYGITFKVIGQTLPQVEMNGTYYILNEDRVLVTTGKYTYIQ